MPEFEREAKERQGTRTDLQHGGTRATKSPPTKARDEAAKLTGVSPRAVQQVKRVEQHAPELLADVKAGRTSLRAAEKEARAKQDAPMRDTAGQQAHLRRASLNRMLAKACSAVADLGPVEDEIVETLLCSRPRVRPSSALALRVDARDKLSERQAEGAGHSEHR